jgi:hypothetical protein
MLTEIENGTHVMVKLPRRPNKLAPLYEGPYTVVRRRSIFHLCLITSGAILKQLVLSKRNGISYGRIIEKRL